MSEQEIPETGTVPPNLAPATSIGARAWLFLSWLSFFLTTVVPLVLVGTVVGGVIVALATAGGSLHTGGLALDAKRFHQAASAGILLTLACAVIAMLRGVQTGTSAERERVIGPGGRVLRVIHRNIGSPKLPWWLPGPYHVLGVAVLCLLIAWDNERAIPAGLSLALILACAHLLLLFLLLFSWECLSSAVKLYRFARATPFRRAFSRRSSPWWPPGRSSPWQPRHPMTSPRPGNNRPTRSLLCRTPPASWNWSAG